MQKHTFYGILSIILIPVAVLFGIMAVFALLTALANPPMLLPVFMIACVAIYIFASRKFLTNGILRAQPCKKSLKDWIKVNAIVSIIFATLGILQSAALIIEPSLMNQALDTSLQMQGNPQAVPKETLLKAMKVMLYVFFVISVILLTHVIITFGLLKKYRYVFEAEKG
jgi:hypothetical protein